MIITKLWKKHNKLKSYMLSSQAMHPKLFLLNNIHKKLEEVCSLISEDLLHMTDTNFSSTSTIYPFLVLLIF